ncbi:MAG: 4-(cytidine 5'-diphospho)-2-C-methyl-D-erythritol kinase [Gammaproteobacteria bacterium]|nr:4-(cytidine 5'-diphospho)-2-C-methyl-D-erythritol kinase [Gammaproteobacteria bacterium]
MNPAAEGWSLVWPAPAKLNLFLHIVGQRTDGYHLLQTAFQFIDLCDSLVFTPRDDTKISRSAGLEGLPPDEDLVVRAAKLLSAATGIRRGVDIRVDKKIPSGGGLGGGSSDAATTLLALNRLWRLNLGNDSLQTLGLKLGADVPVFVGGRAAWGEGTGEKLSPMDFPAPFYVVVKPACGVVTADVFQDPELTRNSSPVTIPGFLSEGGRNDCEAVVRRRYPEVAQALDWLGSFGDARLTGTGSCVFLATGDLERAREVQSQVPAKWAGFVVKGQNHSPTLDLLEQLG